MNELTVGLWRSAPLDARLRFIAEILPADDPLQAALKEAIGVVQLWRRGKDLEAWAEAYPSVVVDTASAIDVVPGVNGEAQGLASDLLRETRSVLDSSLRAFGFEWLKPRPGEPPTPDCRCEGEGPLVSACLRPGLRHRGVLLLPAEVRLGASRGAEDSVRDQTVNAIPSLTPNQEFVPEWLRKVRQQGASGGMSALEALASAAGGAGDGLLLAAVDELREALADEAGGAALKGWLKRELDVDVIQPREGERFDPLTMQAISERRTVHAHEADTIARVERPGFAREGRVIAPVEAVRYVAGDTW